VDVIPYPPPASLYHHHLLPTLDRQHHPPPVHHPPRTAHPFPQLAHLTSRRSFRSHHLSEPDAPLRFHRLSGDPLAPFQPDRPRGVL